VLSAALLAAARPARAQGRDLLAGADEIAAQVAVMRRLQARTPIVRGVVTREQIKTRIGERLRESYKPGEIQAEGKTLEALGLLPRGSDYEGMITALLLDQVAGFYDPFVRKLYIADWVPAPLQRPALAHEIGHALADQHFGLKRFVQPVKGESDRQLAGSAVVEGDGMLVMLQFTLAGVSAGAGGTEDLLKKLPDLRGMLAAQLKSSAGTPALARAPRYLRDSLFFPYLEGLGLVHRAIQQGGWAAVDRLYRDPPTSTEQVLHPEKYFERRERPVPVTDAPLAPLLARRYTALHRDVMGEFQTRQWLLENGVSEAEAASAAAGWGGDRLVSMTGPDGTVAVVWRSVWDSSTDADEFVRAARVAAGRLGGSVEQRGASVLVMLGVPSPLAAGTARAAWTSWKETR
jgi:hypothetical protein